MSVFHRTYQLSQTQKITSWPKEACVFCLFFRLWGLHLNVWRSPWEGLSRGDLSRLRKAITRYWVIYVWIPRDDQACSWISQELSNKSKGSSPNGKTERSFLLVNDKISLKERLKRGWRTTNWNRSTKHKMQVFLCFTHWESRMLDSTVMPLESFTGTSKFVTCMPSILADCHFP